MLIETKPKVNTGELKLLRKCDKVLGVRPSPVDNGPWGILTMQAVGDDIIVRWANPMVKLMTGVDDKSCIGKSIHDIPEFGAVTHSRYGTHLISMVRDGAMGKVSDIPGRLGIVEILTVPCGPLVSMCAFRYLSYYDDEPLP